MCFEKGTWHGIQQYSGSFFNSGEVFFLETFLIYFCIPMWESENFFSLSVEHPFVSQSQTCRSHGPKMDQLKIVVSSWILATRIDIKVWLFFSRSQGSPVSKALSISGHISMGKKNHFILCVFQGSFLHTQNRKPLLRSFFLRACGVATNHMSATSLSPPKKQAHSHSHSHAHPDQRLGLPARARAPARPRFS